MNKTIIGYLRNPNQKTVLEERAKENGISFSKFLEVDLKMDKEQRIQDLLKHLNSNTILIIKDFCALGKSVGEIYINLSSVVETGCQVISLTEKLELNKQEDIWKAVNPFCHLVQQTQKLLFSYVREENVRKK